MKKIRSLIAVLLLIFSASASGQKGEKIFRDTAGTIATDSFVHDLGSIPKVNNTLVKFFKYTGKEPAFITRTWTGDPHFICEYPHEPLVKGKIYSFTVCFAQTVPGVFNKTMGFDLSNGERISFVFKANVLQGD